MKKLALSFLVMVGVIVSSHDATAKSLKYDCPYINDTSKQTIGQLSQGYDGWFFKKPSDFKQDFTLDPMTLDWMKRFSDALNKRDAKLIFLPVLPKGLAVYDYITEADKNHYGFEATMAQQSYDDFTKQLKNIGILVPDFLHDTLRLNSKERLGTLLKADHHWSPEGAKLAATSIANILKQQKNYADFQKVKVRSVKTNDTIAFDTKVIAELNKLCTSSILPETLTRFDTQRDSEKTAEALFGDSNDRPEIALTGTSFSDIKELHFADFLEEETALEITNYSISGGELYGAIISYMMSPYFHQRNPKYIIWEASSRYNYNRDIDTFFRQLIPAVSGECTGDKIIAQNNVTLDPQNKTTLLDGLTPHHISGSDYYIYISDAPKNFTQYTLDIEYDDGDGEWFTVDHSGRYKHYGIFYIELSDDIDSHLSHIKLDNIDKKAATMSVKLCKK